VSKLIQIPCVTRLFFPETSEKLIQLVKSIDSQYQIIENDTCCGLPFFEKGDLKNAKKTGEFQLKNLQNNTVISCGKRCSETFQKHYTQLFNNTVSHNEAIAFSKQVTDFNNLIEQLKINNADKITGTYFYIFDCYGDLPQQEKWLNLFSKVEWHTSSLKKTCCGAGTCLPVSNQELSFKLAEELANQIIELNISNVVFADDICRFHFMNYCKSKQLTLNCVHIIDLLHQAK
jgi:L-lactate dehydrogenase complex protein LldE